MNLKKMNEIENKDQLTSPLRSDLEMKAWIDVRSSLDLP